MFDEKKMIEGIEGIKERDECMSVSVAGVKDGKVIFRYASGLRDKENNIPTDVDTIYRCASVSKHVSVITVMTLVDKGLLDLDEDISVYFGYKVRNPYFPEEKITIRQIMAQISSFTEYSYSKICAGELPAYKLSEILREDGPGYAKENWFEKKPGTYYSYNNFSYGMLGTLCEIKTGKRVADYAKEAVLEPLGIRGSFNPDDFTAEDKVAKPYEVTEKEVDGDHNASIEWLKKSLESKKMLMNLPIGESYRTTQGNLYVVPSDLARIEIMLMNGGVYEGKRILSEKAVEEMMKEHFFDPDTNRHSCLGLYHDTTLIEGEEIWMHPGRAFGAFNTFFFDPAKKTAVICFTNGTKGIEGKCSMANWTAESVAQLLFPELNR